MYTGEYADIGVVIPAYNAASTLARAIDSVLAQTVCAARIIVVDDGSTDHTREIVLKYGSAVQYVFQQNAGVAEARNRGVRELTCEWVALLDADDEWMPKKLECQIEILRNNPQLDWCAGSLEIITSNGFVRRPIDPKLLRLMETNRSVVNFFDAFMSGLIFQTSALIFRRSFYSDIGGFDSSLRISEDRDLMWRAAAARPMVGYCPAMCCRYYANTPESLTKKVTDKTSGLLVVCKHLEYPVKEGDCCYEYFRKYLRVLGIEYLVRSASGKIHLSRHAKLKATAVLQLTWRERALINLLRLIPSFILRRVSNVRLVRMVSQYMRDDLLIERL